MTPTLFGRWQTRAFLLGFIGLPITLGFVAWFNSPVPIAVLTLVLVIGFGWDVLYQIIQRRRWDYDWPPNLQLAAGIVEVLFIAFLLYGVRILPFRPPLPTGFIVHYWTVWIATFLASQSLMRLIFPRWRFDGGQWLA